MLCSILTVESLSDSIKRSSSLAIRNRLSILEFTACPGIDMTKVMIPVFGWIYLHVVIDWGTKKLLSTHMSLTSKSADWIAALNEAVNLQFPHVMIEQTLKQMLDKGIIQKVGAGKNTAYVKR